MKVPFWATREFRWLVMIGVMAVGTLAVLAFEILPLLSERAVEPAVPDVPPEASLKVPPELKESLESAVDSSPIDLLDPPYRSLVLHVAGLPAGEIKEAVPIPYGLLGRDPAKLRGSALHIEALFLETQPTALKEQVDGIEYVYRTYLMDPGSSAGNGYVLDLLEQPPGLELGTTVAADALFLKIGEYETKTGQYDAIKGPATVKAPFLVGRDLRVVERKVEPPLDTRPLMIAVCGLAVVFIILSILFRRQANVKRLERLAGSARPVLAPGPGRSQFPANYPRPQVAERKPPPFKFRGPPRRAMGGGDVLRVSGKQRTLIRMAVLGAALVCTALIVFNSYVKRSARERPALDRGARFATAFREADEAWKTIQGVQEKAWLEEEALGKEDLALIRRKLRVLEKSAVEVDDLHFGVRPEDGEDARARHLKLRLRILDVTELTKERPAGEARNPEDAGFYIPFERAQRIGREARRALEALAAERTAPPTPPGAEQPASGPVSPGTPSRSLPEIRESLSRARAELLRLESFVKTGLNQDGLTARDLPELGVLQEESRLLTADIQRAEALAAGPPPEK